MYLLECVIFPGAFSGELGFRIQLEQGSHNSAAARQYFWEKSGKAITQPPPEKGVPGYIAARVLRKPEPKKVLVSLPDGEVLEVNENRIISSPEPLSHVPFGS